MIDEKWIVGWLVGWIADDAAEMVVMVTLLVAPGQK